MGRPWWYDSYWEKKDRENRYEPSRNRRGSSLSGCLITLLVIFVLLIFGLAIWMFWNNQVANKPSVENPSSETAAPPVTPVLIEPTHVPTLEPVKTPPTNTPSSTPVAQFAYTQEELIQYALELINKDRADYGLSPVTLGNNTAAQKHAEERLANGYISHWGMDGLKPYMRYTLAGGMNYEAENGSMRQIYWIGGKDSSYRINPKETLEEAQEGLMTSPGHRKNILNKWHKKVNLGIAYDTERLDLVQQFEGDYINFTELPTVSDGILSIAGEVTLSTIENIIIYYDPLPQPLSIEQLDAPPYDYAYGFGEEIGVILPPLPSGFHYIDLLTTDVIAFIWNTEPDGFFNIEADISTILEKGMGVYTVVVWVETDGDYVDISNYSIFIR